jgi:hypothetical protein
MTGSASQHHGDCMEAHFGDDSESESYDSEDSDEECKNDDVADTNVSQAHDARQSSSSASQCISSTRKPRGDASTAEKMRAYVARAGSMCALLKNSLPSECKT